MYDINLFEGEIKHSAEMNWKRDSILHAVSEYMDHVETNQIESLKRIEELRKIFKDDQEAFLEINDEIDNIMRDMNKTITDAHVLANKVCELAEKYYK